MRKTTILTPALLLIALIATLSCSLFKKAPLPENILIITLDTTRPDGLGCYGNKKAATPFLDSLARESALFLNCHTTVPLTLPAHSTLFTSLYPISHGVRNNGSYKLPEGIPTLPEIFRGRGHFTAAVISAYVLLGKFGLNRGFDHYEDSLRSTEMNFSYKTEIRAPVVYEKFRQLLPGLGEKKFLLWLHFYDPHSPYDPLPEFKKKFPDDSWSRYLAEVATVDHYLEKVFADLRARNLLEKTAVFIVGDHGEGFREHGEQGHGLFCYEESLKIPLLVSYPPLIKPSRLKQRVNIIDIMPTVLELCRIDPAPAALQGKSFLNLLQGKKEPEPRNYYFESMYGREEHNYAPLTGIIHGDYKFINLPRPELYNTRKDPAEKENLLKREHFRAKELDRRLESLVGELSGIAHSAKKELSAEDRRNLQALGYISGFSSDHSGLDPKEGIKAQLALQEISRLISENKLQEAGNLLEEYERGFPGVKPIVYFNVYYKYFQSRRQYDKALQVLQEGARAMPGHVSMKIALALFYFDTGNFGKARSEIANCLKIDPDYTRAHTLLGEIAEKERDLNGAARHYARAIEIEPDNISLILKQAEIMLALQRLAEAKQLYDRCLENVEVSDSADLQYKIALLNMELRDYTTAEKLLERVVRIKPSGKSLYFLATILIRDQRPEQGVRYLKQALEKHASDLTPGQLENSRKAIRDFQGG